jgi:GWxTD domain-containing protein
MTFGRFRSLLLAGPCLVLLLPFSGDLPGQEALGPSQTTWLEDVSPIMTKIERDVFLKLRTGAERDKFIAFFWKMRDATPDTAKNEFKKDYMERVRFADQTFGRDSSTRGSQTERGYYYLVLGPPLERNLFTTASQVWPSELWFYEGATEYGLPDHFYLIFYQPHGIGDFRLYYPGVEGPEKLVTPQQSVRRSRSSGR